MSHIKSGPMYVPDPTTASVATKRDLINRARSIVARARRRGFYNMMRSTRRIGESIAALDTASVHAADLLETYEAMLDRRDTYLLIRGV